MEKPRQCVAPHHRGISRWSLGNDNCTYGANIRQLPRSANSAFAAQVRPRCPRRPADGGPLLWGGSVMGMITPDTRLRLEWAETAVFALEHCRVSHANAICAAWLEGAEIGGPRHDPFGMVYSDARFWALGAPQHELVAYTLAGLERLPSALLPL